MTRSTLIAAVVLALGVAAFVLLTRGGETEPAADVVAAIEAGAPVLDVRTEGEYASGHVAGALHANVLAGGFRQRVGGLDRDRTVYVYCASGRRSGWAAAVLEDMGFRRVVNAGGLADLAAAGAPVE
jgi:phage shock protein E